MQSYIKRMALSLFIILFSFSASAEREITDQLNRKVKLPDKIERAVVLQHQTLNLIVQLDATDRVVGILAGWKRQLGANYERLAPELAGMAMPGDLNQVNIESLLALKPDVVFVTNYAPPEMIAQIEQVGIPAVAISLRKDTEEERAKINPVMEDEEYAYNEGLKEGILVIGEIMGKQRQAEELVNYTFEQRVFVTERLKDLTPEQRIRVYMANPDLSTYGSGKYTGLMMQHAGAMNVAATTIKGFKQVSIEDVLRWDPEVIFVQERYPSVVDQIRQDKAWQNIKAVKNDRVYLMPEYAKAWGYPMPEAMAIGELWLAKKLYPQRFEDIDMAKAENDYYRHFYRTDYQPAGGAVK